MNKTTGTRITVTNFVGSAFESGAWTADEVETWGESLVDDFAAGHRENETDAEYTAVYGEAQTFEYEVPGLRVVALLTGGELMTVWTIEKSLPAARRIQKAADREQPVTITYTKADGTETVRTIEPLTLKVTKAGDTLIQAMDRLSGEKRSFRLDRVSAYTVHRTRRTVRTEAPAPTKAELAEAFRTARPSAVKTDPRPQVLIKSRGWTGRIVRGSRALSASGWSSVVDLDGSYRHHTASGTVRISEADLITLTELDQRARATV